LILPAVLGVGVERVKEGASSLTAPQARSALSSRFLLPSRRPRRSRALAQSTIAWPCPCAKSSRC